MTEPKTDAAKAAALLQQGLFHHRQRQLPQAMERYIEVLKGEPTNADALYYVAVVACEDGQYQQGIDLAKRAIEVGKPQARVHNLMGQAYDRLHQPLEAIKAYDAAIALDPNFAAAHGNRGTLLHDMGRLDQAIESFERALALAPDQPQAHAGRGVALMGLGKFDDALTALDRAIKIYPAFAVAHRARAATLIALKRDDEAKVSSDRADEIEKAERVQTGPAN